MYMTLHLYIIIIIIIVVVELYDANKERNR